MSAAATVLQLVRAHYRRDESAFAGAAAALARSAKTQLIRNEITDLIRRGFQQPAGATAPTGRGFEPLPPAQRPRPIGPLNPLPTIGFAELLLEPQLQAFLDEIVLELEYRDELATRKLRARNRFLFHGPPGNGKTSSAAALANALGVDVSTPAPSEGTWAVVELFGHVAYGAFVVEVERYGATLARLHVPLLEQAGWRLITDVSGKSFYRFTECSEAHAREFERQRHSWRTDPLPRLPAAESDDEEDDESEDDEDAPEEPNEGDFGV